MKKRIVMLAAILALLLLGTVIVALAAERGPTTTYAVMQRIASGGRYQLTGPGWQMDGVASGGSYQLVPVALESPQLTGNGCCCTYLPCIFRDYRP